MVRVGLETLVLAAHEQHLPKRTHTMNPAPKPLTLPLTAPKLKPGQCVRLKKLSLAQAEALEDLAKVVWGARYPVRCHPDMTAFFGKEVTISTLSSPFSFKVVGASWAWAAAWLDPDYTPLTDDDEESEMTLNRLGGC